MIYEYVAEVSFTLAAVLLTHVKYIFSTRRYSRTRKGKIRRWLKLRSLQNTWYIVPK